MGEVHSGPRRPTTCAVGSCDQHALRPNARGTHRRLSRGWCLLSPLVISRAMRFGWAVLGGALVAGHAEASPPLAANALPGINRVGIAKPMRPARLTAAATVGYGFTEAQSATDRAHHRQLAALALAVSPISALEAGLRLDQRYDAHSDDGRGTDGGVLLDSTLRLRAPFALGQSVFIAPELGLWLPGSESASTSMSALTPDARLIATLGSDATLASLLLGYRVERSFKAAESPDRLRRGDRLALGLSDFDAVLVGIAAAVAAGKATLEGELSADILVGSGAPRISKSPLRAFMGVRVPVSLALDLTGGVEVALSSRPDIGAGSPLIPIEPRVTALLGLRYAFSPAAVTRSGTPRPPTATPERAAPKPTELPTFPVDISMRDDEDQPVIDAEVTLEIAGKILPLSGDGQGHYRAVDVPAGQGKLRVKGGGVQPIEQTISVSQESLVLEVRAPALPPTAQVRGLVRSFQGKPLVAKIRIEPAGLETTSDATGAFQIDVEPGKYEVVIETAGFASQRRTINVGKQGVVMINADLVRGK